MARQKMRHLARSSHNCQHWARLKPEAGSFIWVSHMGNKDPNPWAILRCVSQTISKELD